METTTLNSDNVDMGLCDVSDEENPDNKCLICLYPVDKSSNDIEYLPCAHFFHSPCVQVWLNQNPICPICKTPTYISDPETFATYVEERDRQDHYRDEESRFFHMLSSGEYEINRQNNLDQQNIEQQTNLDQQQQSTRAHLLNVLSTMIQSGHAVRSGLSMAQIVEQAHQTISNPMLNHNLVPIENNQIPEQPLFIGPLPQGTEREQMPSISAPDIPWETLYLSDSDDDIDLYNANNLLHSENENIVNTDIASLFQPGRHFHFRYIDNVTGNEVYPAPGDDIQITDVSIMPPESLENPVDDIETPDTPTN